MPFDRLVKCVDAWAGCRGRSDVVAQIGNTDWRPLHLRWTRMLDAAEFRHYVLEAECVITHAGIGTILTALELVKPVLIMPRRGNLGETRNDHQFGTAHALARAGRVSVAWDEDELRISLDQLDRVRTPDRIPSHASLELLSAVRRFVRPTASFPHTRETPLTLTRPVSEQERKAA